MITSSPATAAFRALGHLAGARVVAVLAAAAVAIGIGASVARADGDPGSDVLVTQNLFATSNAGLSIAHQLALGDLLATAQQRGLPIRVAIIAKPNDLGAVTGAFGKPRDYASFLGYELSLAYTGRLLVVMPDGFGVYWQGHPTATAERLLSSIPISNSGEGFYTATQTAVRRLAAAAGIQLAAPVASGRSSSGPQPSSSSPQSSTPTVNTGGRSRDMTVAIVFGALIALAAIVLATRVVRRRPLSAAPQGGRRAARAGQRASRPARERADRVASESPARAASERPDRAASSRPDRAASERPDRAASDRPDRAASDRPGRERPARPARQRRRPGSMVVLGAAVVGVLAVIAAAIGLQPASAPAPSSSTLASNPYLDPGTSMSGPAPNFTLYDQFGRPVSLASTRGKVVILAFTDSQCTTVCPLTTTAMVDAKAMLGPAASQVALLGIDANPAATSIEDVATYSQLHGMTDQWQFLTGSLPALKQVWANYKVESAIQAGEVTHTPALFVIDRTGQLRKVYMTQQSYAAVGQLGQLLAQEASQLLPSHPPVRSRMTYAEIPALGPSASVKLPSATGPQVRLGPGHAHLLLFFATWDREVTSLGGQLARLNRYASSAAAGGLPALTAVDEGSVEPSPTALPDFLRGLPARLAYPVAIDRTGQVADGYEVQGQPWFVLTSASGQIVWYWQVSTQGWPTRATLVRYVRAALARAPKAPATTEAVTRELQDSPPALAAIHAQADQLLGSESALVARIRALRGYPVVVNAWGSWCEPCQAEFGLFASASARYGRRVAFLGADSNDSTGDARAFLATHPVSYPSYQTSKAALTSLVPAGLAGLPTTIFVDRAGKVVYVHTGQYESEGSLTSDIDTYALGGS